MVNSVHKRSKVPLKSRIVLINHKPVISREKTVTEATHFNQNQIRTSKYTLFNFLPKNLFQQFRRIGNLYFLFTTFIQIFTNSPVSPATSLVPLLFVVLTTSIKQGYEDWLRHKNDLTVNNKLIQKVSGTNVEYIRSYLIHIGDILLVEDEQEIPCDVILLSSDDANGTCSVTTANLDGETNLKKKRCVPLTKSMGTPAELTKINGYIECEEPNTDLYDFTGLISIKLSDSIATVPLSLENILLRGSRLMNTKFIYGVACYTGDDTKMSLNSKTNLNKFSSVERSLNYYLVSFLFLLFAFSITLSALRYGVLSIGQSPWYLQNVNADAGRELFLDTLVNNFFEFFVLLNYLIPMSLYVCLELIRFFGVKVMLADKRLVGDFKDPKTFPVCNCSDLNEELGQVTHLLSDKTGTLTENKMRFVACSINDQLYEERDLQLHKVLDQCQSTPATFTDELDDFFVCLAVCNTVSVKRKKRTQSLQRLVKAQVLNVRVSSINSTSTASLDCGNESIDEPIEYSADSPDELALVQAAARYHIKLIESSETQITVSIHDRPVTYQRLMCLPFDSNRKRMSVLLRAPDNRIVLFMKGAENVIYSRLIANSNADITLEHIDYFARLGLRTLMLGCRHLSAEEYDLFTIQLKHAYASLTNQQQVEKCHDQLESNIRMLGATAVEDRLQEDVPSTIADLKYAGISIWLLTGDKLETALAVACASRLVDDTMELLSLSRQLDERTCGHQLMEFLKQILLSKKSKSSSESTRTSYNKKLHQFLKATLSKSHALERGKTNRPLGTDLNLIQSTNGSNVIGSPDISRSNSSLSLEADDLLGQSEVARRNNAQTQQANFQKEAEKVLQHCRQTKKSSVNKFALLVDGRSLHISLRAHRELFRELAQKSMVVVCGRMSPIQKAQMVRLVKTFDGRCITAAIGDGVNDISMIQEANVGFGIMGQEGVQAVRSSDFAFSKFRFVRRILLVHGHHFYVRITTVIHYYFYKSLVFVIPQLLYARYNMYSAQTLYHGMILMMFNLLFSSTPVFIYGLFDKYIPSSILSAYPLLFRSITKNHYMKGWVLYKWILVGTIQGLIAFYSIYNLCPSTISIFASGQPLGIYSFGLIIAHIVVIVVNLKVLIMSRKLKKYLVISLLSTVLAMPTFCYVYSSAKWNLIDDGMYGQFDNLLWSPTFWLILAVVSFFALLPDLILCVSEISLRLHKLYRVAKQQLRRNVLMQMK